MTRSTPRPRPSAGRADPTRLARPIVHRRSESAGRDHHSRRARVPSRARRARSAGSSPPRSGTPPRSLFLRDTGRGRARWVSTRSAPSSSLPMAIVSARRVVMRPAPGGGSRPPCAARSRRAGRDRALSLRRGTGSPVRNGRGCGPASEAGSDRHRVARASMKAGTTGAPLRAASRPRRRASPTRPSRLRCPPGKRPTR